MLDQAWGSQAIGSDQGREPSHVHSRCLKIDLSPSSGDAGLKRPFNMQTVSQVGVNYRTVDRMCLVLLNEPTSPITPPVLPLLEWLPGYLLLTPPFWSSHVPSHWHLPQRSRRCYTHHAPWQKPSASPLSLRHSLLTSEPALQPASPPPCFPCLSTCLSPVLPPWSGVTSITSSGMTLTAS